MPVGNLNCLVPSTSLQLLDVIGRGSLGIVHRAEWSFHAGKVSYVSSLCILTAIFQVDLSDVQSSSQIVTTNIPTNTQLLVCNL